MITPENVTLPGLRSQRPLRNRKKANDLSSKGTRQGGSITTSAWRLMATLKSWAVPKGPTLDSKEKRLAVHVEDHPIEYGEFEGTIPDGNYGAGQVTIWDSGTYDVLGEPDAAGQLDRGDFKFQLHGSKLLGNFALVKIKSSKKNEWLLLKKPDFAAQEGWDSEDHLEPVRSPKSDLSLIPGAKLAPMPERIEPMLATLEQNVPQGSDWLYEIKWDGYRGLCYFSDGKLAASSRATGIRSTSNFLNWKRSSYRSPQTRRSSMARSSHSIPPDCPASASSNSERDSRPRKTVLVHLSRWSPSTSCI